MENPNQPAAGKVPPMLPSVPQSSPPVLTKADQHTAKSKTNWLLTPWIIFAILLVGILMSAAGGKGVAGSINLNGKPEVQALNSLCSLNLSSQASRAQALCTARGLVMATNLADEQGKFPLATFRITSAKENPNLTDIQMVRETADGTTIIFARMVDDHGWKFDDIYIAQAKGKPVKIWLSKAVEDPLGTALSQVDWHQAAANANTILDLCQKFKQTFGENHSQ